MPRTRKSATTRPSHSLQSTLSFNNKSARVTKSGSNAQRDEHSASAKKLAEVATDGLKTEDEPEVAEVKNESSAAPAVPGEVEEGSADNLKAEADGDVESDGAEQIEEEVSVKMRSRKKQKAKTAGKDEREIAAEKITDAQLKKYWQAEEDSRLAPRVHQSDLSLHEKILRHFDLSSQYGPCIGIPRLQRWRRANTLGLEPPVEVLAVLLREQDHSKSQGCGKMAYIDELSGGRVVLVE
ncbi:uncharacterized protein Z520_00843 [Fonsecaea multimorphosa CBS 102226]|uniref:DNA polymerase delta subunit 4 n=1 Tax=Fonsecaea multimorphosa CBS 102226 TaxID=1442371 RepID=A0A0D2HQL1_9EURO|nr:uncharacterized protein Z520_00843 [Fonsecaea multimorphosa CBS 102226]KIY04151.1 hypothetical protein Z520_00843 [Fonsecaea multimorphosa CBS 102226]OAL31981.1 hypothetical protein AYO22_00851 [Fonsecaea multimorphosa]